eukprot:scaffold165605_cov27-Tisochrysis_lutea.AAC.1
MPHALRSAQRSACVPSWPPSPSRRAPPPPRLPRLPTPEATWAEKCASVGGVLTKGIDFFCTRSIACALQQTIPDATSNA